MEKFKQDIVPDKKEDVESLIFGNENDKEFLKNNMEFLYPRLDDDKFNEKILVKEFIDTRDTQSKSMKIILSSFRMTIVKKKIKNFELDSHQKFVRNFFTSRYTI